MPNSAFLNGYTMEEVHVKPPHGFGDNDFPKNIYKVIKFYMD